MCVYIILIVYYYERLVDKYYSYITCGWIKLLRVVSYYMIIIECKLVFILYYYYYHMSAYAYIFRLLNFLILNLPCRVFAELTSWKIHLKLAIFGSLKRVCSHSLPITVYRFIYI